MEVLLPVNASGPVQFQPQLANVAGPPRSHLPGDEATWDALTEPYGSCTPAPRTAPPPDVEGQSGSLPSLFKRGGLPVPPHATCGGRPRSRLPPHQSRRLRCGDAGERAPQEPPSVAAAVRRATILAARPVAGSLSEDADRAWRQHPRAGNRWLELVVALRSPQPVVPSALARLLRAIADLEAEASGGRISDRDQTTLAALASPPDGPLPLPQALPLCTDPDGYASAAAQSALEAYGGVPVAAAAHALAADLRSVLDTGPPFCPLHSGASHGRRGRSRRGRRRQQHAGPAASEGADSACEPAAPNPATHDRGTWEQVDAVDLAAELRNPVPTLQDVPHFMRTPMRNAFMSALNQLRWACEAGAGPEYEATARAWKQFLLAPRMLLACPAHHNGPRGREELRARVVAFQRGKWCRLLRSARHRPGAGGPRLAPDKAGATERRRQQASAKVRISELSWARHVADCGRPRTRDRGHLSRPYGPSPPPASSKVTGRA